MQVLCVILDNHIGGISVRAVSVADRLRHDDIFTLFVVPNEKGGFAEYLQKQGFAVHQIILGRPSTRRIWANVYWILTFPISVAIVMWLILDKNIDVVHVNGLMNLQAAVASVLLRKPIVWHLANTMYPRPIVQILMPIISRIAYVITISNLVDDYYCGSQICRRRIVHEPVDVMKFMNENISHDRKVNLRNSIGLSADDFVVGSVGNITPYKGYEYLIESACSVVKQVPKVRFVVVGACFETQLTYRNQLTSLVSEFELHDNVLFLGQRDDIMELLPIFDLFVLPSIAEGTPIAILEAMASGLPVIAAGVGGVPDLVIHDVTGYVVPPKNPGALSIAMLDLIQDSEKRASMGRLGRLRVERYFSLDECVSAHKEVYASVTTSQY